LQWKHMKKLPWGLLLLFGGGLALASAIMESGLGSWFGNHLIFLKNIPKFYVILILVFITVFLTEILSNTALTISLVPIVSSIAIDIGFDVHKICIFLVLAASCAFMLPIATPPNAVVYSSEKVKLNNMIKIGLILNFGSIVIFTFLFFYL